MGNTIIGFQSVSPAILDAANGMGMGEYERLRIIELPMALSHILTGLRHAFILNLATAAIGAVIGAGGLGVIIMSGLTLQNSALVLSGTIVIAGFALIGDFVFSWILTSRGPNSSLDYQRNGKQAGKGA
jgi:osmoprotectant transport system permease protein